MGIVNMLLTAVWFDGESGEYVDAIVFVRDEGIVPEVVIEPREKGDMEGFLVTRDEWEELKEFVDREFARLDEAEKELSGGDPGNE